MKSDNPPEKQHFLPIVYLKQFSVDGAASKPGSWIWRLTPELHLRVKVNDQNLTSFGYSRSDPFDAENQFTWLEKAYGKIMKRVWNLQAAESAEQYFMLIWMIVSLHLRNLAYENRTGAERIKLYNFLESEFVDQFVMNGEAAKTASADLFDWRVMIFHASRDLLTSDNPSLWINHGERLRPSLMLLPLTPRLCAVAYDRRFTDVRGNHFSDADATRTNWLQMMSSRKAAFLHRPFTPNEQTELRRFWARRAEPQGFVDSTSWRPNILHVPKRFDFQTKVTPS